MTNLGIEILTDLTSHSKQAKHHRHNMHMYSYINRGEEMFVQLWKSPIPIILGDNNQMTNSQKLGPGPQIYKNKVANDSFTNTWFNFHWDANHFFLVVHL